MKSKILTWCLRLPCSLTPAYQSSFTSSFSHMLSPAPPTFHPKSHFLQEVSGTCGWKNWLICLWSVHGHSCYGLCICLSHPLDRFTLLTLNWAEPLQLSGSPGFLSSDFSSGDTKSQEEKGLCYSQSLRKAWKLGLQPRLAAFCSGAETVDCPWGLV